MLKHITQDVAFGVFRNERGEAELEIQVVKDAKGMTFTPSKRLVAITLFHVARGG